MKKLRFIVTAIAVMATLSLTSFAASTSALLKIGSRGDAVRDVQTELQSRGYFNHEVTGYFGEVTQSAVMNFQKKEKIQIDGIVGPVTRERLFGKGYSDTDLYWLSRIIYAEARGESYKGKVAVGNTVLNRVKSSDFPDTVKGVIFDTKYGVQYTPVANGTIYNTPDTSCINAAKDALSGVNFIGKCMYFYNPRKATSSWISNNRPYYTTIGNHAFHL